jgi:hypothetical protein
MPKPSSSGALVTRERVSSNVSFSRWRNQTCDVVIVFEVNIFSKESGRPGFVS